MTTSDADLRARLRVAIVDDEALARRVLREFLSGRDDVEIVAECQNGFEAVKAVAEQRPDLVLLDIQMPRLDGFEVLELIGPDVAVIFVTAFDEYALKAFDVHAVDYLLKPFDADRLATALARARADRPRRAPADRGDCGRGAAATGTARAGADPRRCAGPRAARRQD